MRLAAIKQYPASVGRAACAFCIRCCWRWPGPALLRCVYQLQRSDTRFTWTLASYIFANPTYLPAYYSGPPSSLPPLAYTSLPRRLSRPPSANLACATRFCDAHYLRSPPSNPPPRPPRRPLTLLFSITYLLEVATSPHSRPKIGSGQESHSRHFQAARPLPLPPPVPPRRSHRRGSGRSPERRAATRTSYGRSAAATSRRPPPGPLQPTRLARQRARLLRSSTRAQSPPWGATLPAGRSHRRHCWRGVPVETSLTR